MVRSQEYSNCRVRQALLNSAPLPGKISSALANTGRGSMIGKPSKAIALIFIDPCECALTDKAAMVAAATLPPTRLKRSRRCMDMNQSPDVDPWLSSAPRAFNSIDAQNILSPVAGINRRCRRGRCERINVTISSARTRCRELPTRGQKEKCDGVLAGEIRTLGLVVGPAGRQGRQGRSLDRRAQLHRAAASHRDEEGRQGLLLSLQRRQGDRRYR